jgi:serine/threonine protein kinase
LLSLEDWLYTKQLDLPLALNFALQFCSGMNHAYTKMGLIHRDIKPGNILLTWDKTVKITDFGLSKTVETPSYQAKVPPDPKYDLSSTAGTPPYMAPEQFTGKEIDTRTDIYSFGIVLYQIVTGQYPYSRKSSWEEMHCKGVPLLIKEDIPAELSVLIYRCLEKNPTRRYQNFSDLHQALFEIYLDVTGKTIPEESEGELEAWELINKGYALYTLGRSEEALTCYDEALKINLRYAEAWTNKGVALGALGRPYAIVIYYNRNYGKRIHT